MDVICPTSWDEANLDTATPRDRAPLLALACAIRERWDALGPGRWSDSIYTDAIEPAIASLQRMATPEYFTIAPLVVTAIRELRKKFLNLHPDYATLGYQKGWPDYLERRYNPATGTSPNTHAGLYPDDLFDLHPVVPHSASGDSTAAATTRAFWAWARACLDEMVFVLAERYNVDKYWYAANSNWSSFSAMVADATLATGASNWFSGNGYYVGVGLEYDAVHDLYWHFLSIPKKFSVCNRSPIAAKAHLVLGAQVWPGGAWQDTDWEALPTFDTFGISGASGLGPVATAVDVAGGGWAVLWNNASCPAPTSALLPPPGLGIPSASGINRFSNSCELFAYFDFSETYRFRPDPEEPDPEPTANP